MSRLQEISDAECEMQMTPMIDVTFLLLIFFMCTIKFKTLEGKLAATLPKDVGVNQTEAEPIEKVEIMLKVVAPGTKLSASNRRAAWSGTGRFVYAPDRLIQFQVGPKKTTRLNELEDRLKSLHRADPERPATIDARPGVAYEEVVKVLDLAIDAGFDEITFVGSYED